MDGPTFDAIAKRLGSATGRRHLFAGLLSGALSGLISRDTEAKRKSARQKDSKRKSARQKDSRRKTSGRKKRPDTNADAGQLSVSAMTIPDCGPVCRIVEEIGNLSPESGCRELCDEARDYVVLAQDLIDRRLIAAGQALQLLQRFFAEGIIDSVNQF